MVQVVVPEGAAPGSHMLVRMPSGTDCSIEIPPNAPPGAVLVVPDPGATPRPVQAVAPPVEHAEQDRDQLEHAGARVVRRPQRRRDDRVVADGGPRLVGYGVALLVELRGRLAVE